jgi:hypothetical protein
MPLLDGFGVLEALGSSAMPAVIFVTAHDRGMAIHPLPTPVHPSFRAFHPGWLAFSSNLCRLERNRRELP